MDDGINIQGRPTPTLFEIIISGMLIARARAKFLFSLAASELRSIAVDIPYRTTAANTYTLTASTLRSVIVPVSVVATGACQTAYALTASVLRTVVVHLPITVSPSVSNTFSVTSSDLRTVGKLVAPSRDTAVYAFSLVSSNLA